MKEQIIRCGQITLYSSATVSDPIYESGIWCAAILENVKPGLYNVTYTELVGRTKLITAIHKEYKKTKFEETPISQTAVDSATAGIFDTNYYAHMHYETYKRKWIEYAWECADQKGPERRTNHMGIVSPSGYGDGVYPIFIARNEKQQIIGIKIEFFD